MNTRFTRLLPLLLFVAALGSAPPATTATQEGITTQASEKADYGPQPGTTGATTQAQAASPPASPRAQ